MSRTLQNVGGLPVEFAHTTRTSRRRVEIDRATLDELRRWRRPLGRDGLPCGPHDWMSCNTTGRFLKPESLSQLFDRIVQRSGLPRVRVTTCATPTPRRVSPTEPRSKSCPDASVTPTRDSRRTRNQHLLPGMSGAAAERFAALGSLQRSQGDSVGVTGSGRTTARPANEGPLRLNLRQPSDSDRRHCSTAEVLDAPPGFAAASLAVAMLTPASDAAVRASVASTSSASAARWSASTAASAARALSTLACVAKNEASAACCRSYSARSCSRAELSVLIVEGPMRRQGPHPADGRYGPDSPAGGSTRTVFDGSDLPSARTRSSRTTTNFAISGPHTCTKVLHKRP